MNCLPKLLYIVLFLFFYNVIIFSIQAQDSLIFNKVEINPLAIGDVVPESLWTQPLTVLDKFQQKKIITLNQYREKKTIVLDFWATWCGGCRYALKEVNTISKELEDAEILFLPVTYQSVAETGDARKQLDLDFIQVYGDKILSRYFIHTGLPHTVVIKDGRFYGIMKYVGENTVSEFRNLIEEKPVRWKYNTQVLDTKKTLFSKGNGLGEMLYQKNGLSLMIADSTFVDEALNLIKTNNNYQYYANSHSIKSLIYMVFRDELDQQAVMTLSNTMVYMDKEVKQRLFDSSKMKLAFLFEGNEASMDALKMEFKRMIGELYGIGVEVGNWLSDYDPKGIYRKLMIKKIE